MSTMSLKTSLSSEHREGIGSRKELFRKGSSPGHMDPIAQQKWDPAQELFAKSSAANQNAARDPSQRGRGQEAPAPAVGQPAPIPKFDAEAIKAAQLTGV